MAWLPPTRVGGGYGNFVILDHGGGWLTLYAHLVDITVNEKDKLQQGDPLGTVGGSGGVPIHLHYEQRTYTGVAAWDNGQPRGTPQKVVLDGVELGYESDMFVYNGVKITSNNCPIRVDRSPR